jgi:hypothetical protein
MDGKKRTSMSDAYDKSINMLSQKAKTCPKGRLLKNCLVDAEQCYRLSKDNFWKKVMQYLELNFEREAKKLYI